MSEIWVVRSTFAKKDEAISAAKDLLSGRLIACANVTEPVTSLYRWEGMVQQEQEVVLWAKTTAAKVEEAIVRLKVLNHYQVPAVLAWPVSLVNVDFAAWIQTETV